MRWVVFSFLVLMFSNVEAQYRTVTDDCCHIHNFKYSTFLDSNSENLKSESAAYILGLGITTLSFATFRFGEGQNWLEENEILQILLSLGIMVGPNAGSIYAKDYQTVLYGLAFRGGSIVLFAAGGFSMLAGNPDLGSAFMIAAALTYVVSASVDIFYRGPKSVRKYNEEQSRVAISPWIAPDWQGAGISTRIRF